MLVLEGFSECFHRLAAFVRVPHVLRTLERGGRSGTSGGATDATRRRAGARRTSVVSTSELAAGGAGSGAVVGTMDVASRR